MALDQQQTFNWLVEEKARLETELAAAIVERDRWAERAVEIALAAAQNNPAIRAQIERERKSEMPDASVLDFVFRALTAGK